MANSVLNDLLARLTETGRALLGPDRDKGDLVDQAHALLSHEGEASGVARARAMLDRYETLSGDEKLSFFRAASEQFGPDRARLEVAMESYRSSGTEEDARLLHLAAEPRSQELIRRLNRAQGGMRGLVMMRQDLLAHVREHPELAVLDEDFRHLFASWFNRGFLELRRINWSTPASILEKIIQHEAVHQISDWSDLRRRVGAPDRQLYAFFHPALVDDPLIFVEVALTAEIPAAIGPILAEERDEVAPRDARTAVFYSISNCQEGLRGISFGNFLIKQVVEELRRDVPSLTTFVTLSPVPGLRRWIGAQQEADAGLLSEEEWALIKALEAPGTEALLDSDLLARVVARYLVRTKRTDGGPIDPVARFHLGNGARIERINLAADLSERGRNSAFGVMVNYLYDLDNIERNHEVFAQTGKIAQSSAVRRLAKQG